MTEQTSAPRTRPDDSGSPVHGGMRLAAVLLMVGGVMAVLQGIAAIHQDQVFARVGQYVYKFDLTAWGWILLVVGVIAVAAGAGVLRDEPWGRTLGIAIAAISMIANFLFIIYIPVWGIVMIGVDMFILWALVRYAGSPRSLA